ncbi:transport and Golgi organization 5 isoform X2 [Arctopsyche grandis]
MPATQRSNGDVHTSSKTSQREWSGPGRGSRGSENIDASHIVLWRHPLMTIEYFFREIGSLLMQAINKVPAYKGLVLSTIALAVLTVVLYQVKGPHQSFMQVGLTTSLWWGWWIMLGILSSVGFGSGLHTFILYLGPHIAQVTLAAYECGGLNFPSPPYPNEIICPSELDPKWQTSIWNIMSKVRVEAMLWGLGTALGELPPYFMARAARLAHKPPPASVVHSKTPANILEKSKIFVQRLVEKVGFLGILACASIPNPLFDLAGLTCGHFLVPFWTFFGATLIGKAVIKMHLQKMFVIVAFNESLISQILSWLHVLPGGIGAKFEEPILGILRGQRAGLHRSGSSTPPPASWLSTLFDKFVLAMIGYFVLSIVNSLAQSYYRRAHKMRKSKKQRD